MTPYYQSSDGMITLYHGDCREILPVVAPPSDNVIVLADPLYGIGIKTTGRRKHAHQIIDSKGRVAAKRKKIDRDYPDIGDHTCSNVSHLLGYQRLLAWGWNHISSQLPETPSLIVWDKRDGVGQDDGADCEVAWTNLGGPARVFRHLWRGLCQASEKGHDGNAVRLHPTQKPEAFYRWLYAGRGRGKPTVNPGDIVVAPYLGSGPEIVPTMELGLKFIGIDVEREYLDTAIKHRIEPALERGRQLNIWAPKAKREEQLAMDIT